MNSIPLVANWNKGVLQECPEQLLAVMGAQAGAESEMWFTPRFFLSRAFGRRVLDPACSTVWFGSY